MRIPGLVETIRLRFRELSPTEQALANYVVDHGDNVAFWTAQQLGDAVGVSDASVIRFARSLGFPSYVALQAYVRHQLRELLQRPITQRLDGLDGDEAVDDPILQSLTADVENLLAAREQNDLDAFRRVVDAIVAARRRYVVGLRSSAGPAVFFAYHLRILVPDVVDLSHGPDNCLDHLLDVDAPDVVVAIGLARPATRSVEFVQNAKKAGAAIVACVSDPLNPLSTAADHTLWVPSTSLSVNRSPTAAVSVLQAILTGVSRRLRPSIRDRLDAYERLLVESKLVVGDHTARR